MTRYGVAEARRECRGVFRVFLDAERPRGGGGWQLVIRRGVGLGSALQRFNCCAEYSNARTAAAGFWCCLARFSFPSSSPGLACCCCLNHTHACCCHPSQRRSIINMLFDVLSNPSEAVQHMHCPICAVHSPCPKLSLLAVAACTFVFLLPVMLSLLLAASLHHQHVV